MFRHHDTEDLSLLTRRLQSDANADKAGDFANKEFNQYEGEQKNTIYQINPCTHEPQVASSPAYNEFSAMTFLFDRKLYEMDMYH